MSEFKTGDHVTVKDAPEVFEIVAINASSEPLTITLMSNDGLIWYMHDFSTLKHALPICDHDWVTKDDSSGEVDGGPGDRWSYRECRSCGATDYINP